MSQTDWTALGTCVGAVGAAAAAFGTVGTLLFAIRSTNQAREESRDLQSDAAEAKKREQANQVCGWIHGDYHEGIVAFFNGSPQPVYNVVVHWVYVQGAAWSTGEQAEELLANDAGRGINHIRQILQLVPPGKFELRSGVGNQDIMQGRPGIETAFTDMANNHWIRRAEGQLEQSELSPLEHYKIGRPLPAFDPLVPWDESAFGHDR